jgi:hypothetical protein
MGVQFTSFKQVKDENFSVPTANIFAIDWAANEDYVMRTVQYSAASQVSWETIADGLLAAFLNDCTTHYDVTANPTNRFDRCHLVKMYVKDTANGTVYRTVDLAHMKLKLFSTSSLAIQNRTLANSGANPEHHDSMFDVENNPVEGYKYTTKGSGFTLKFIDDTVGSRVSFLSHDDTGVLFGDPDDAGLSTAQKDLLQRPPGSQLFQRCFKSRGVKLAPGAIRKNKMRSSFHMNLNVFMRKMVGYLRDQTNRGAKLWIGKSEMFAFEKMMHTSDATEPDMSIGYEVNNFYGAYVYSTPVRITVDKDV